MPALQKDTIILGKKFKQLEQEVGIASAQLQTDEYNLEKAELELKQAPNKPESGVYVARAWVKAEEKNIRDSKAVLKVIENEKSKIEVAFKDNCKRDEVDFSAAYKAVKPSFFSFSRAGLERKDGSILLLFGLIALFGGLFVGMMFAAPWSAGMSGFMAVSLILPLMIKLPLIIGNNVCRGKLIREGEGLVSVGGGSTTEIGMTRKNTLADAPSNTNTNTKRPQSSTRPLSPTNYNPSVLPIAGMSNMTSRPRW